MSKCANYDDTTENTTMPQSQMPEQRFGRHATIWTSFERLGIIASALLIYEVPTYIIL